MAIESLITRIGSGAAAASSGAAGVGEATRFAEALRSPSASVTALPSAPAAVREVQVPEARRAGSGGSLGHRILDSLETIHRNDRGLRSSAVATAPAPAPLVRTASLPPGPAAAAVGGKSSDARPAATGAAEAPDFDTMLRILKDVGTHVIHVSLATKTTSSFTSSLNKLMSSS